MKHRVQRAGLADQLAASRRRVAYLERGLVSNRRIGMAVGILMARRDVAETQAFAALHDASQRLHRPVLELAEEVIEVGELRAEPASGRPGPAGADGTDDGE